MIVSKPCPYCQRRMVCDIHEEETIISFQFLCDFCYAATPLCSEEKDGRSKKEVIRRGTEAAAIAYQTVADKVLAAEEYNRLKVTVAPKAIQTICFAILLGVAVFIGCKAKKLSNAHSMNWFSASKTTTNHNIPILQANPIQVERTTAENADVAHVITTSGATFLEIKRIGNSRVYVEMSP